MAKHEQVHDDQAGEERGVPGDRPTGQARTVLRVELATVRGRNQSTAGRVPRCAQWHAKSFEKGTRLQEAPHTVTHKALTAREPVRGGT